MYISLSSLNVALKIVPQRWALTFYYYRLKTLDTRYLSWFWTFCEKKNQWMNQRSSSSAPFAHHKALYFLTIQWFYIFSFRGTCCSSLNSFLCWCKVKSLKAESFCSNWMNHQRRVRDKALLRYMFYHIGIKCNSILKHLNISNMFKNC